MQCSVWPDIYAKSWPAHDQGELGSRIDLADALTYRWDTDARFAAYSSQSLRRLSTEAADRIEVTMDLFVVDIDAPKDANIPRWRAQFGRLRLDGRPFAYWTRSGLRLIWRTKRSTQEWSTWYVDQLLSLYERYGLCPDPQCRDWTRLFRLPHTVRDGVPQEHGYFCGDPSTIGEWVEAEVTDRHAALAALAVTTPGWASLALRELEPHTPVAQTEEREIPRLAVHAIRWAVNRVESSTEGERNAALFAAARWLAERQDVPVSEGQRAMEDVAHRCGLKQREIVATLKSAYRKVS